MNGRIPESMTLAYGGNALKEGWPDGNTIEAQERAMTKAAKSIVAIRAWVNKVVVVHGNGPQVGWMAQRSDIALEHGMHPVHLRNLVASSQGAIGTSMVRQVVNVSPSLRGKVVEVGTQVQVDENDPAFKNPSKPIGDFMTKARADEMRDKYGWVIMERNDSPDKEKPYRRMVASPEPVDIAEISTIRLLVNNEIVTVCCGGGGVPYILKKDGTIEWVDAVIDKDLAAALAGILLQTRMLTIFTASDGIYTPEDFQRKRDGDLSAKPVPRLTVKELEQMSADLPAGSMGPKAEALRRFTATTGNVSWVGPLDRGFEALTTGGGTKIVPV
ncbi:hypothetical protein A3B60_02680 [Candidatus Peregrinibacteria bacterium RIFCSPLOWO2_01_FULL_39_12]|nr:MAG: hypothetical protein A3B60_02680 [Candidatus Peregrinibacteria bacterium RIFCSPLOWO2_01_FULL_39_12]